MAYDAAAIAMGRSEQSTQHLTLEELGWREEFREAIPADVGSGVLERELARVASVHAAFVDVWMTDGPRLAKLRSSARRDAPIEGGIAVGDWVLVGRAAEGSDEVVVEAILPRRTAFLRQAAGERAEPQAIAANIDRVFVVTAAAHDFNLRRLERYLVAVGAGGAEAQILLTKADLVDDVGPLLEPLAALAPAFATSAKTGAGLDELIARIPRGTTAAVVGSSGVGKSALVNRLLGRQVQLEGEVRAYDGRGRHTTTRRELFSIPDAGLLIDTPGMRELKPWISQSASADEVFDDITHVANECRYRDCRHESEPGCAVIEAVAAGTLERDRVDAWRKLAREQAELSPRQSTFAAVEAKRQGRVMTQALRKRVREKE